MPLGEATLLSSVIHVVPEVAGVTIPAAALVTTADGQTGVVLADGALRPVVVVAVATGVAVVEGVEASEQVRTPGELPAGAALGTTATLAGLAATGNPLPGPQFALAVSVAAVLTATIAALPPAVLAARRDPLHELRVP